MDAEEALRHYDYVAYLFVLQKRQTRVVRISGAVATFALSGAGYLLVGNAWVIPVAAIVAYLLNRAWSSAIDSTIAVELIRYSFLHPVVHRCADIDNQNGNQEMRGHLSELPIDELRLSMAI